MVKAADALADDGYDVHVVSAQFTEWAARADADLLSRRDGKWKSTTIDYRRSSRTRYLYSGARFRSADFLAALIGPERSSVALAARARGRIHSELADAAASRPADLVYGSGTALAAAAFAADRVDAPFALDLEDFHTAEEDGATPRSRRAMELTGHIESELLPKAAFLTGGSDAIARAYLRKYNVRVTPIHNVFEPIPEHADIHQSSSGPLRMYWFSQTIGPGRGLEDVIRSAGIAEVPLALHLRGSVSPAYLDDLGAKAKKRAPLLEIVHHEPGMPDDMVELSSGYDIGIATEQLRPYNRAICLTNKAFIYMSAGLAVALTDTEGQHPLVEELGADAVAFAPGDVKPLASALQLWSNDRAALGRARRASLEAARRRWRWSDPAERGKLLELVATATREEE
jgi:glycosyltransferase involved in cell wall biosynthesis